MDHPRGLDEATTSTRTPASATSKTIATTAFQDGGKPIIVGNKCGMYQQASFYANFSGRLQEGRKIAEDGDVFAFYLPAINPDVTTPIVGGGEFVTAFADRPEVQSFQTYLSSATRSRP